MGCSRVRGLCSWFTLCRHADMLTGIMQRSPFNAGQEHALGACIHNNTLKRHAVFVELEGMLA